MPLIETFGSGSAKAFGLNSAKNRIAITLTGTARYLGYAQNGLQLTATNQAYWANGGTISTWTTYTNLPSYLQGGVTTMSINDNSSTISFYASDPVRLYMLRNPTWNTVDITGWTLVESGRPYFAADSNVSVYYKDFPAGNTTGLDNDSAMYIFQPGTYIPYESPLTLGISNLAAWYDASTWSTSGVWGDMMMSNNTSDTTSPGSIYKSTSFSNTAGTNKIFVAMAKDGSTAAGIRLPDALDVHQDNYTFFHVTRRQGSDLDGRIWDGTGNNWLSGFHGDESGVFYHEDWISVDSLPDNGYHGTNWAVYTDQLNNVRSNKISRNSGPNAGNDAPLNASNRISLHYGSQTGPGAQNTSWAVAEALFFNRKLSESEIIKVEDYLASKYGITAVTLS